MTSSGVNIKHFAAILETQNHPDEEFYTPLLEMQKLHFESLNCKICWVGSEEAVSRETQSPL